MGTLGTLITDNLLLYGDKTKITNFTIEYAHQPRNIF